MTTFIHNQKKYNVKEEYLDSFIEEFPDATTVLKRNGVQYSVEAKFYKDFINNVPHVEMENNNETPLSSDTPSTSPSTSTAGQTPTPTPATYVISDTNKIPVSAQEYYNPRQPSLIRDPQTGQFNRNPLFGKEDPIMTAIRRQTTAPTTTVTTDPSFYNRNKPTQTNVGHNSKYYSYSPEQLGSIIYNAASAEPQYHNTAAQAADILRRYENKELDENLTRHYLLQLFPEGGDLEKLMTDYEQKAAIENDRRMVSSLNQEKQRLEKEYQDILNTRDTTNNPFIPSFATNTPSARNIDKTQDDVTNIQIAIRNIEEAEKRIEATHTRSRKNNGMVELGKGVADKLFDINTFTLGLQELSDNIQVKAILDKYDNNEQLTQSEEDLLYSTVLRAAVDAAYDPGMFYKVGTGFAESIPFIIEFIYTGGIANAITKGVNKKILNIVAKLITRRADNITSKAGRFLTKKALRTGAGLASGSLSAAVRLPFQFSTYNNILRRNIGETNYTQLPDGQLVYTDNSRDDMATSFVKGIGASFITNLTETFGGKFINEIGGIIGKGIPSNRLWRTIKDKVSTSGWGQFMRDAGYQGAPAEFFEELMDGSLNAIFIGDQSLSDVYSADNLIQTAGVTLLTSVFMGAGTATMTQRQRHKINKAFSQAEYVATRYFNSQEMQQLNDIALGTPTQVSEWNTSITHSLRSLSLQYNSLLESLSPQALQYLNNDTPSKADFYNLPESEQQTVNKMLELTSTIAEYSAQRDYVVAAATYNAYIKGLKDRVEPQATAMLSRINKMANNKTTQYTIQVDYNGTLGYLIDGDITTTDIGDGTLHTEHNNGHIYSILFENADGSTATKQLTPDQFEILNTIPTQSLLSQTEDRIYKPIEQQILQEKQQAQAEVAQSNEQTTPILEQTTPILEQTTPILEQTTPILEQTSEQTVSPSAYSSSASRSEDRGGGRRPEGLNQDNNSAAGEGVKEIGEAPQEKPESRDVPPVRPQTTEETQPTTEATTPATQPDISSLNDEEFDTFIDTITPTEAIEAITQHRGVEEADQYAQWRKGILTKERDKAQKALNAKVKPFDPSRYPDYAQMKREERKYNEALQATHSETLGIINRTTAEIADIDRYLADRNRQIAAEREAENPLRNGIAQAVEKLPINTLEQYIARLIALGQRLRMSDQYSNGLSSELGITPGSQEHRELLSILSNTEGMTPEQLAHHITENIEPEYRHLIAGRDAQDIRNTIIDTIQSGITSRKKAYDYIAGATNQLQADEQRYYEQQELQAEIDADTEQAIREYEEFLLSSLTPDDLAIIDDMAGDYWDEILAIQQYEQEAYNSLISPSAYSSSASRSEDRGSGAAEGVVSNSQNIQTYDTTTTTTTPRNTQQGAESRTIQPSTQPSNTTPIRQDSQDTTTERPATPQPNDNGSTIADNEREGEQIYSNDRRGDSRHTSQWQDSISSQQELDENGHPFVISSNGTTTFGEITENSGLQPAPIKLSKGYQDENGKGYGLAHIEANHGKQIRNAGFNSVEDFVSFVAQNYDEDNIRVGKRRKENGNITYLIQVTDQYDNTLFIELSRDGSYWNVNSGGVFRKDYANKKETVVKTEPQQPNNAVSTGSSLSEDEKSSIASTEPNGEPTVSTGKANQSSSQSQEINEEINKQAAQPDKTNNPISYNKETNTWHNVPGKWFTSKPDRFGNITAWGDHNRIQLHYNNGAASIHVIIQDNYAETPARMIDNIETAGFDIQYSGEKLPFVKFQTFDEALAFAQYLDQLEQQIHQSSSDNNTITPTQYTITPTQYTTKRGNVLDMQLVKFANDLTKEQYRTAKELAKADKGWYDRDKGGFMMRSEESAKQLADTILNNDNAESNAQPISMTDIKALNDGDIAFTGPVNGSPSAYSSSASRSEDRGGGRRPEGLNQDNNSAEDRGGSGSQHTPIWQYSIHVDTDGYTVLTREDVSSGIAVGDALFSPAADSPEEMLEILRNPHNNMQEVLDAVGVILENKIKTRQLDRKIAKQRKQEYEALRANGVNGYKIGEKVIYKGKEATIYDFEQFGTHQPVLDTGMAPVIYEVAKWSDIQRIDKGKSPVDLNSPEAPNLQEQITNQGQFGLVSDDRMAQLKERLRRKLGGQMNIGIDPEILSIGLEIAVGHLDRGIKSFTDFARTMIADLGDTIRPYLKAFYNGARELPEVVENGLASDMTPYDEVQRFDVANFDKQGIDAFATAQTVKRETEVADEVKVAKQRIKRSTEKKKSLPSPNTQLNLFDNPDNNNKDAREQDTTTNNRGTQPRREELPETESVEPRTPLQHAVEISRSKRGNTRTSGNQLGNRPLYDVNKNYSNEEISQIVSSVTDIVDGRVVITAPITDDIRAICHQYKSGGVAKKGHGILDEYYTDGKIVDAVSMLITPYFNNSNAIRVLEPSVGVGNFISAVDNIPTSEIVTFEINPTTARIAKILYPGIDVNLRSFETEFIDDAGNKKPLPQKYNLIIGNPPYGSHRGLYKGLGEESKIARYEDYFVKRSLDVLNEGGILAMVLPSSWIDRHTRYGGYTIESAYRLPSGAFEATQVGTDIVVLRKESSIPTADHTPYFEQHPERVLGEVKQRKGRYGKMEDYVQGDIDTAIEAIKRDHASQIANRLDIAPSNDNLNNIEEAIDETGSPDKATAIVQTAKTETNNPAPSNTTGKKSKYKTELNRGVETVPTSQQFTHTFSEGEVEAFYDTEYDGTINHPSQHRKYANYIGGRAMHDFYYAEGDIYAKLDQLEREKEEIITTYGQEQYDKQKRLLMSVLPKRKGLSEITISPNTTFVKNLYIDTDKGSTTLRDAFIDFCKKLPYQAFGDSSSWEVRGYVDNEQVYGQDKERNALVRERRKRVANDLFVKFLNEELSQTAQNQVVAAFNREYNSTYRPDYSRVPMFSTINKDFRGKPLKLTSVQLAGIGRMTVKGVGVLAHEVGFGKTLSGILAMHEAMTRGFATKPLIVVPNDNILKQWVETIKEVLPQATVNTLGNLGTSYDLTDFKVNDGEFTLVTYEGLKAMSFSDDTYNRLAERFSYITEDLKKHQSERDIQKEIEKKKELKGKMKRGTKTSYGFEDFGFDWLTVDEVHNCNHIISKVRLDKSVSSDFRSQNQRTSDLGLKTWLAAQYIQEENNGRNVLLLSATPFTNKPLEYYSILSLVGNKMLKSKGFFHVDQFFSTFMEADNELEIGANGRPTQKTNVRRFRNNGLFQQLLSEFIDIKGEEDNPELVRPDRHNKEYKINPNELTEDAMAAVQDLLNDNDTVLQGIGHARQAAFSPYATSLLGITPKNHREFVKNSPKINATIKLIEQNKKDRPDAGQIIYSEVGVEFFPMIRDYLVNESGFKPSEVRIITGATSNAERVNIQSAFNKGEVKVVIGSPAIKEGLNLQENTTDMYILSLPWNFTQLRQIEGRGWRQGNKWENIRINYMLTNNSVDVFMLQRLQLKQGLYNEAMKKGAETLDVSDIDTSELKTALITDPAVRAEIVTVQEREKLQQQRTQIEADLSFVLRKYESYNKLIEKLESKKKEINQFKEWAAGGNTYWADRLLGEENKLNAIVAEIQEEKERLQKKGVNVDDIVLQTEQSQKAIEDINQKIENLKEHQKELTEKYRREQELKQQQQGDLLDTYIKERKAENNSGTFYKIRPKEGEKKIPKNISDRFSFRELDDETFSAPASDSAIGEGVNESSITPEEQAIIDQARANGTYLLAPNGQPTNLTPRQWVQVRTRAFKRWFGDWEKQARIEKLRNSTPINIVFDNQYDLNRDSAKQWMKDNIRGEYTNKDTGETIQISKVGANKVTSHGEKDIAHLQSIVAIPQLIENAIFIDEQQNEKGNDKYDSYRYYVCGAKINGEDYTIKIVIGVKGDSKYYDHRLTQIEKGILIDNLNVMANHVAENQNASYSMGKDSKLLSILQTNASKIVDSNGEPMVVYHGSNAQFTIFDNSHNQKSNKGFFFTDSNTMAQTYGNTQAYFLNIPNAYTIQGNGSSWNMIYAELTHLFPNVNDKIALHRIKMQKALEEGTIKQANYDYWQRNYYAKIDFINDSSKKSIIDIIKKFIYALQIRNFDSQYTAKSTREIEKAIQSLDDNANIIFRDILDYGPYTNPTARKQPHDVFVVTNPNQIKSATDNIGTFDNRSSDIRFRELDDETFSAPASDSAIGEVPQGEGVNESSITPEEQAIIDQARANGTYLLAPNGQPTNLTPRQWVQVRTRAFKRWFGDWEKQARVNKLRYATDATITGNEIEITDNEKQNKKNALEYGKTLQGEYTNKDTGNTIQLQRGRKNGGINEVLQHNYKDSEHLQSIAAIPQIIVNSIFVEEVPNKDTSKNPDVVAYQHYVCGLKIGNTDYTVHSLVAVDKKGDRYYDHNLIHIEKIKLLDIVQRQAVNGIGFGTTPDTESTTNSDYKYNALLSILQTNASKIVDENGEPRVMYHGTDADITTFFMQDGSLGRGAYFTSNWDEAAEYAKSKQGVEDIEDLDESKVLEVFLNVRDEGNITHSRFYREDIEVLATTPNQIKSATDNIGTFDNRSSDIRFRSAYDIAQQVVTDNMPRRIEERTRQLAQKLGVEINVIHNNDQLRPLGPEYNELADWLDGKIDGRKHRTVGMFDSRNNQLFVFAHTLQTTKDPIAELERTITHEVVTHYGLRQLLGNQQLEQFMSDVWQSLPIEEQYRWGKYAMNLSPRHTLSTEELATLYSDRQTQLVAAEEYIAHISENGVDNPTIWDKICSAFRRILRRLGLLSYTPTQADIRYLLAQSYHNLTSPTQQQTISPSAYSSSASRSEDRGGGRRPEGLNQDNNSAVGEGVSEIGEVVRSTEGVSESNNTRFRTNVEQDIVENTIDTLDDIANQYEQQLAEEKQSIEKALTPQPTDDARIVAQKILFRATADGALNNRDNTPIAELIANDPNKIALAMEYNDKAHRFTRLSEANFDSMQRLSNLLQDIKKKGGIIDEDFDPWVTQNQAASRAQAAIKTFNITYRQPLYEAINKAIHKLFPDIDTRNKKKIDEAYYIISLYVQARTAVERQAIKERQAREEAAANGEEYQDRDFGGLAGIQYAIFGINNAINNNVESIKTDREKLSILAQESGIPTVQEFIDNIEEKIGVPAISSISSSAASQIGEVSARTEGLNNNAEGNNNNTADQLWNAILAISEYQLSTSYQSGITSRTGYQTLTYGSNIDGLLREKYNMQVKQIKDHPGSYDNVTDYDKDGNATGTRMVLNNKARIDLAKLKREYADAIEAVPMPGKNGSWQQLIDSGWMSADEVSQLHRYYQFYSPLKGHAELTAEDFVDYEKKTPRNQSKIKAVEGHTQLAKDPFNQLILDTHGIIQNAMQNQWRLHLYEILNNNPNASQYIVEQRYYKIDTSTGQEEFVPYGETKIINGVEVFIPGRPTAEELANGKAVAYNNRRTRAKVDIPIRNNQRDEHSITVMVHGEPYTIFFYDKRIADAINGRNIKRFDNKYFQRLQQLNRLYAGLKTSLNPTFTLISNLRRDWLEMTSNNFIAHGAWHALLSFYNRIRATRFGSVQNAIRKYQSAQLRSINDATSDVERYVVEFFENGGAVNITQLPDYNTAKVDLMSDIETYMRTGKLPEDSGVINYAKNKFNNMAERVELAPRIATYIASRTIGRSVNQSVNDAKEVTVNFDRKGAWSGVLGLFQLFYNASAQSVRRQIHLAKHHPIRFLTNLAMVFLASPIYSLLLSMLLGDADDWEENCARYFSINPELRRRYNIILIGDRYIRLPMAVNYLPYSTLGDVIANAIFNPNKRTNYTQDALDLTSAVLDTFIPSMFAQPIGFSFDLITARNEKERENALRALFGSIATPIAGALFGQFTEPIMQGIGNYNFMGGTLYDTPFNKNSQEPSYIRARQYTQPVWIWASQLFNDATGGNEIKKGWVDVPPEAIENMMTILGGWGEYGENILSIAGAIFTKDTNTDIAKSVPLFSRLYGGKTTEQYNKYMQSLFYTDISRMEQYREYRKNATKKGTRADFEREYTPDERRYFADIATLDKVADKIRETIKKDTPEGQHPQYYMDPRMIEIYNTANRQAQSLLTHQSYTPIDDPYYIYMYMRDAIEKNPYLSADGTYTNLSTDEIRQSTINEIKDLWESYSIAKRSMDKIKGYYPGMTLDIYQQQHYNLFVDEITKWKNKYPNIDLYNLLEHMPRK